MSAVVPYPMDAMCPKNFRLNLFQIQALIEHSYLVFFSKSAHASEEAKNPKSEGVPEKRCDTCNLPLSNETYIQSIPTQNFLTVLDDILGEF